MKLTIKQLKNCIDLINQEIENYKDLIEALKNQNVETELEIIKKCKHLKTIIEGDYRRGYSSPSSGKRYGFAMEFRVCTVCGLAEEGAYYRQLSGDNIPIIHPDISEKYVKLFIKKEVMLSETEYKRAIRF